MSNALRTFKCEENGCGAPFQVPVHRGRRHHKCEAHRPGGTAQTARRERVRQAKATGAGVGTIAAPVTVATVAAKATGDPVADAAQAAQAAVDALAAAVAERDAQAAAQAAAPAPMATVEGLQHYRYPELLEDLQAGNFPYLVGPAGSGKTTAARHAAKALGMSFSFIACTPEMGEHKFFGFITAGTGEYKKGVTRDAWQYGGLVLIDEMDKGSAEAVAALNGMLALPIGAEFTFPDGENVPRHPDFYVIAAGNTTGHGADDTYVAAAQLDGSSLDRFTVLEWGYDESLERAMVPSELVWWAERVQTLRKAAKTAGARLLITPRATEQGARLLARGNTPQDRVEDRTVWKECPEDTRRSVLAHV